MPVDIEKLRAAVALAKEAGVDHVTMHVHVDDQCTLDAIDGGHKVTLTLDAQGEEFDSVRIDREISVMGPRRKLVVPFAECGGL